MLSCHVVLLSQIQIGKCDCFAVRNAKPPVHTRGLGETSCVAAAAATSGINRLVVLIVWSACCLSQIFTRAGTRINKPLISQSLPGFQIVSAPLALRIRTMLSAAIRPFVPPDSEPLQVFDH